MKTSQIGQTHFKNLPALHYITLCITGFETISLQLYCKIDKPKYVRNK